MKSKVNSQKSKVRSYAAYLVLCTFFLVLISGCRSNKNTWLYRGYHNMNSRYNGYFYSRENMKESIKKVEKAYKEDYTKMIPIWIYPDNKSAKSYYADFDKSIKKSSLVIHRHAITDKKKIKEIPGAVRWIDENYILIGQAHFYKRDLFSALEAFEYVAKTYKNQNAKYSGLLWMMHADNEIGSYSLTQEIIDDIRNSKDVPDTRSFKKEYALLNADLEIKTGEYASAIRDMEKAISFTKSKKEKARDTYILAQLYEKVGDPKNASALFGKVPPLHPNYEMEFNAKINQARLFDAENGDSKEIKKELTKMLKDDKNIEYRDQIYFAFANIAYREKDIPLCMDYLSKSIKASTTNTTQKALSYLKRADILFDQTNYRGAEVNYDTTMQVLPKDYPDYAKIDEKQKALSNLVFNLKVIETEDSLQTLARLSETERNAKIDKIIAKIEEEEKEKAEAAEQAKQDALNAVPDNKTGTTGGGAQNGAWYFYNPATVSFGAGEFLKKWGSRKLEDNWNRADKNLVQAINGEEDDTTNSGTKGGIVAKTKNKKDRNYYLKKIPLTEDALAKSTVKIVDAYYNAGTIYKEQILNNQKSVETLEELLKRYPENKFKMSCYYQLYRTYLAIGNQQKSDYYKNIILNDYPDTQYAQIIRDPNKAKDLLATKSEVEMFYTGTYGMYTSGRYAEALANCIKAETDYSKSNLISQFAFIKALCIGRTQDINAFEAALQQVVIKYPKNDVKPKAQDILDAIKKQRLAAKETPVVKTTTDTVKASTVDTTADAPKFVFKEDGEYYWVMIWDNNKGNINNFKIKLSNATTESFGTLDLSIQSIFLDLAHQLISVKTFDGKEPAMNYYNFFKDRTATYTDLEQGSYQTFIISAENYTTFYKDKNIDDYQQFFTQNYQ